MLWACLKWVKTSKSLLISGGFWNCKKLFILFMYLIMRSLHIVRKSMKTTFQHTDPSLHRPFYPPTLLHTDPSTHLCFLLWKRCVQWDNWWERGHLLWPSPGLPATPLQGASLHSDPATIHLLHIPWQPIRKDKTVAVWRSSGECWWKFHSKQNLFYSLKTLKD